MIPEHIDDRAQSMIARCAAAGQATVDIDDRHEAEALRAELRRLARTLEMHVRTIYQDGRLTVLRLDDQPWDPSQAEAAETVAQAIRDARYRR